MGLLNSKIIKDDVDNLDNSLESLEVDNNYTYLDIDYSFCLFCDKHTLVKNTVHCNFCDSCHSIEIYDCKKCDLYYETIELQNKYKKNK